VSRVPASQSIKKGNRILASFPGGFPWDICSVEDHPMKRSSRVWKKKGNQRWKWRKKKMRRRRRAAKMRRGL